MTTARDPLREAFEAWASVNEKARCDDEYTPKKT